MTNNNFNKLLGYVMYSSLPPLNKLFSSSEILKYDGTKASSGSSSNYGLGSFFNFTEIFGEAQYSGNAFGIFLTLGTDDTPPTRSDLKLGNSIEDFVWLSGGRLTGNYTKSNDMLIFNAVVIYKGSSPIVIKEMGLNCVADSQKFLLARETIEPLVINPDDTYSFVMRIK